jgi:hydroxymethylglutaryl-CoA lyase
VRYTAAVFNDRGREQARAFTPPLSEPRREAASQVNMCDVFAQRNYNRTQATELGRLPETVERARARGDQEPGIGLASAWGSNWTGEFSHEQMLRMLDLQYQQWEAAGIPVTRVSLADPMSWNMPHRVERMLTDLKARWPSIKEFGLHLHNGRGMALASVYAALRVLDSGDTLRLQSSIGGFAGCPYCGNGRAAMMMATEDLMHMLEDMGIHTGVDLYKLIEVVWLAEEILGHPLYGFVSKAGPRPRYDRLYAMDMPFVETLEQARHFIKGPNTYAGGIWPWHQQITSWMRPEFQPAANGQAAHANGQPAQASGQPSGANGQTTAANGQPAAESPAPTAR